MDILVRLGDLHKQATTERSHYYTGKVIMEAMHEISILRREISESNEIKKPPNNTSSPKLPEWEECMEYINGTPKRWNELRLKNTVWVTSAKMCYEFIVRKIGR